MHHLSKWTVLGLFICAAFPQMSAAQSRDPLESEDKYDKCNAAVQSEEDFLKCWGSAAVQNRALFSAVYQLEKEERAWNEVISMRSKEAEAVFAGENIFSRGLDIFKWAIPGYSTIKISYGPAPIVDSLLMGSNLEAQRLALNDLAINYRIAAFNRIMAELICDDPSLALVFSSYMKSPSFYSQHNHNALSAIPWIVLLAMVGYFTRNVIG